MSTTSSRLLSVAARVLRQLRHDHRFLGLSLIVPMVVIYVVKIFIDSLDLASPAVTSPIDALQPMLDGAGVPHEIRESFVNALDRTLRNSQPKAFEPTAIAVPMGAFIVHLITYLLCALVLVRERTAQTLGRMFIAGYRQIEIIGGYLLAYSALATVQSLLVLIELTWLFNLKLKAGPQASIYLIVWMLAVTSVALGILVSNFARTEGQVLPFIPLVAVPSILLSGVIIAVDKLPLWAQWASFVTPLYYANNVIQELIQPDGALRNAPVSLVALPLYGAIVLILASRTLTETD